MYGILCKCYPMDIAVTWIVILVCLVEVTIQQRQEEWEGLTLRYRVWYKLPRTSHEAEKQGYKRQNNVCKSSDTHGFLYRKEDDTKALPIYDLNGWISGIQTIIPGNMQGFNSKNQTILLPPHHVRPPIRSWVNTRGVQMYTITAYFKHPKLVCNPIAKYGIQPGKGLYIQTGRDPEKSNLQIPMYDSELPSYWKPGRCLPQMGQHYFMNVSTDMKCEKLYPLFLMYDIEGKLGAFGWTFQGKPMDITDSPITWFKVSPKTYAFVFDESQLPPCMFVEDFRLFGIHIWLQDHNSPKMTCPRKPITFSRTTKAPDVISYSEPPKPNVITAHPHPPYNGHSSRAQASTLCCVAIALLSIFLSKTIVKDLIWQNH